ITKAKVAIIKSSLAPVGRRQRARPRVQSHLSRKWHGTWGNEQFRLSAFLCRNP
ncbi:hypothetical protein SK128_012913, partial [Halocaridina rubra]